MEMQWSKTTNPSKICENLKPEAQHNEPQHELKKNITLSRDDEKNMQHKVQASISGNDRLSSNKYCNQLIRSCDSRDNSELVWTELNQLEHEIQ
jgi:hypothetical protein